MSSSAAGTNTTIDGTEDGAGTRKRTSDDPSQGPQAFTSESRSGGTIADNSHVVSTHAFRGNLDVQRVRCTGHSMKERF